MINISDKPLLICIEENNEFAKSIQNVAEKMGIQPILVERGSQAIELLNKLVPQFILVDVYMVDMSGEEFMSKLKAMPHLHSLPIIATTFARMIGDRAYWKGIGYVDLLQRPIEEDKLEKILKKYIQ